MSILLLAAVSLLFAQTPPAPNPACSLLTTAQITSLIGAAKTAPVSANPMGSACMMQSEDRIVTVFIVNNTTPDGATRQFESKKLVVAGHAIPGWTLPAYEGSRPKVAVVGFMKGLVLTEVKVSDAAQTAEALGAKLRAVMKEIAAR